MYDSIYDGIYGDGAASSSSSGATDLDLASYDDSDAGSGTPTWGANSITTDGTATSAVTDIPRRSNDLGAAVDQLINISGVIKGAAFGEAESKTGLLLGFSVGASDLADSVWLILYQDNVTSNTWRWEIGTDSDAITIGGTLTDIDMTSAGRIRWCLDVDSTGKVKRLYVRLRRATQPNDDRTIEESPAKTLGTGGNLHIVRGLYTGSGSTSGFGISWDDFSHAAVAVPS